MPAWYQHLTVISKNVASSRATGENSPPGPPPGWRKRRLIGLCPPPPPKIYSYGPGIVDACLCLASIPGRTEEAL